MSKEKRYFILGLLVGIVGVGLFLYQFAPRYEVMTQGEHLLKQDRWSGESWRYVNDQWKRVADTYRDWGPIDKALSEALQIPGNGEDRSSALALLRERFPVLKEATDEELLERIKIVYSKVVLCDLYLAQYLKRASMGQEAQSE